ncbi:hypothetical protein BKI52_02580 [marine bacterium AO1-C]|nr:hypothetical protein BKI52_02580 [marine bacterium AO1-C]
MQMGDQYQQSNPRPDLDDWFRERFAFLNATENPQAAKMIIADELRCIFTQLQSTIPKNNYQAAALRAATIQAHLIANYLIVN